MFIKNTASLLAGCVVPEFSASWRKLKSKSIVTHMYISYTYMSYIYMSYRCHP